MTSLWYELRLAAAMILLRGALAVIPPGRSAQALARGVVAAAAAVEESDA